MPPPHDQASDGAPKRYGTSPSSTALTATSNIILPAQLTLPSIQNSTLAQGIKTYLLERVGAGKSYPLMLETDTMRILSYDTCPEDTTVDFQGLFTWPESFAADSVILPCPVVLDDRQLGYATRDCVASASYDRAVLTIPTWSDPDTSACPSPITEQLLKLYKVKLTTEEPEMLIATAEALSNITKNTSILSTDDIDVAAITLENLISVVYFDPDLNETVERQVALCVLETADNILSVRHAIIKPLPASR
ncbi:uncharacterized protein LOC135829227 [Sycon ciliatum]|uniref:uncharacterized protein LOC135829227 n=1 Tax=Sycon ciliatum TaxID=27933 RepID=UPI0031F6E2FA